MPEVPLRIYPDPILKQPTEEVTSFDSELKRLLGDMVDTMYANRGIGLAAPQVGVSKRITVIDIQEEGSELIELINPQITASSGNTSSEEGCLSIPDFRDTIKRAERVTVEAEDPSGEPFQIEAEGMLAICLQHEIDHLDGVLFIDRLSRLKREMFRKWFRKQQGS